MQEETSALRLDPEELAGAPVRYRLDWQTFAWIVLAVLTALAVLAVVRNTAEMLTRIGVGVVLALALDPVVVAIVRRWRMRRGFAVAIVAACIFGLGALLIVVLGPRAVAEAGKFSEQLPATLDDLENLPLIGGTLRENRISDRAQEWVRELPEAFTDERIAELTSTLISGVATVVIVIVIMLAVLIDGENLLGRLRRLLSPAREAQAVQVGGVMYRTLGRYFGGSITVAILMGLWVLALGLLLGVPLVPLAAVWAMLTDLIPQVGGFLGGSFFVLLATTQGATTALIAAAGFVLYMNLENHVIQPAIVGRSVDLTPPTTMIAAFVGGAIAGVPGALVATPFVGAAKAIYREARGLPAPDHDGPASILGRLRGLVRRDK